MNWTPAEIKSWPKAELHVHLDTSLSFRTVSALRPAISESEYYDLFVGPQKCRDLHHFLSLVAPSIALLQTREALRLGMMNLVRDQLAESVVYTEIRMAPLLHTMGGLSDDEVAGILCRAAADAEAETGVVVRLIFCTVRHFTREQSVRSAELAIAYRKEGVVGFDIAGDEAGFPLEAHLEAFQMVREAGMPLTAHAGEALGAHSVSETLETLMPVRIGHGVRSPEDPMVMQRLKKGRIHLEICPTSNIQVNVFGVMAEHSIGELMDQGISLGINTDGRCLSNTSLTQEYLRLQEVFGWSKEVFEGVHRMTLEAAFCERAVKERLLG